MSGENMSAIFKVTAAAQRPARMDGRCFYCGQPIGADHGPDCVLISKKVKVRLVVEYEVEVPNHWGKEAVEFHRNHGSWCADNALDELEAIVECEGDGGCLCNKVTFEYLADVPGPPECREDGR